MFLENESKLCECRANVFFWRIRLRQPVWSYTPITVIRMISWVGMSVHNIFIFLLPCFVIIVFLSIFDASINFMRCFPLIIEKKKEKKTKTKKLNPWIDLVNLKVLFLRNSKELDFLCDCSNGVCLPNVLKNMFIMLFP